MTILTRKFKSADIFDTRRNGSFFLKNEALRGIIVKNR